MKILSPAFEQGTAIPEKYTCLGANINPPLEFSDIPPTARTLVLILEDADATPTPWTHWMVFDIPVSTIKVDEGRLPEGGVEGLANNHSFGYEGPCPRYFSGTHHYRFILYALSQKLNLPADTEREVVEEKMKEIIVGKATLLGLCTAEERIVY